MISREEGGARGSLIAVRVEKMDGKEESFKALIEFEGESAMQSGECFRIKATPRDFSKEDGFDEEQYRLSDGYLAIFCADSAPTLTGECNSPEVFFHSLNTRLAYRLQTAVGGEEGRLASALLLGRRDWLSGDVRLSFERSGISHLLALSGLHLSIVVGFLELLLGRLCVPKRFRAILILLCGFLFLSATGFSVSCCRAFLLLLVFCLAYLWREHYDSFTALGVALVLILLVTPYAVLSIALWMSFLSAAAIVVFLPAVSERVRKSRRLAQAPIWLRRTVEAVIKAACMGYFATTSLLFVSASLFGTISLASVPMTLLLSISVMLLLVFALLLLLLPHAEPLSELCSLLGRWILHSADRVSSMEHLVLPAGDMLTKSVLAALSTTLILLALSKIARLRILLLPLLLAVLAIGVSAAVTRYQDGDVWYLQELQSDGGSVYLYTKRGEAVLLCDEQCGAVNAATVRRAVIEARCTEIDDLVLYGYDDLNASFLSKLAGRIKIRDLHLPIPTDARERAIGERLASEAELHGISVHYDAEAWVEAYRGA